MTNRKTKALEPLEPPSQSLNEESPISTTLTPTGEPSALLKAAIERQEQELTELQHRMDALGDEFADRAEFIVRQGLLNARYKAVERIKRLVTPDFFDSGNSSIPVLAPIASDIEEVFP
jgi:hypothetical protein